jgi:hypothetical protein
VEELFSASGAAPDACAGCAAGQVCWDDTCVAADVDEGGVHINSAILVRAIALLTPGMGATLPYGERCLVDARVEPLAPEKTAYLLSVAMVLATRFVTLAEAAQHVVLSCLLLADRGLTPPGATGPVTANECISVINAFAAVGLGEPDSDYDGFLDSVDTCPLLPNPEQMRSCSVPIPSEPQAPPLPAPVDPTCPTEFTITYRDDRIVAGTWPLATGDPLDETTTVGPSTGPDGDWAGYQKRCTYRNASNGGATISFELEWLPQEPRTLGLVHHRLCQPGYSPLMLEETSDTKQARVRWSVNYSTSIAEAEAVRAEEAAFARGILAALEPLAFDCGLP